MPSSDPIQKPKLKYAEVFGVKYPKNSVSDLVERYLKAFPNVNGSQQCQMRVLQRSMLGPKLAAELTLNDYRDFAVARFNNEVETRMYRNAAGNKLAKLSPATVGKDFASWSVILTHAIDYWDLPEAALPILQKARRKLKKERLVSKSKSRTRRPTPEELHRLLAHFAKQNDLERTVVDMCLVTEASYELGRRIGELVSIRCKHVNIEKQTYLCYQSKQKVWHEFVLTGRALEIIKERLAAVAGDPEALLFPFNKRTCSSRYTLAKKQLGIPDLRLHDNRRECFSRRFAEGYTVTQVQHGWSGHLGDAKTLQAVYTQVKPEEILAAAKALERRA